MKKIISLILVAVLMFSFAACDNKSKDDTTTEPTTLELDVEELKYNWTDGVLTFANGKQVTLPCTVAQFLEASGLSINNIDINNHVLKPEERVDAYVVGENTYICIQCENLTDKDAKVVDATIVEYSFNNMNKGNKNIKFANTLTVGVGKADVEEALGEPQSTAGDNALYFYKGRNKERKKVELRISFSSENIVNSVAFVIED